jgi:hypothetical protein
MPGERYVKKVVTNRAPSGQAGDRNLFISRLLTVDRMTELGNLFFGFNIRGSVHRNNILIYKSQVDAHFTEFILSDNCSTCFGYHYHTSSGAQNNCNYSIW